MSVEVLNGVAQAAEGFPGRDRVSPGGDSLKDDFSLTFNVFPASLKFVIIEMVFRMSKLAFQVILRYIGPNDNVQGSQTYSAFQFFLRDLSMIFGQHFMARRWS